MKYAHQVWGLEINICRLRWTEIKEFTPSFTCQISLWEKLDINNCQQWECWVWRGGGRYFYINVWWSYILHIPLITKELKYFYHFSWLHGKKSVCCDKKADELSWCAVTFVFRRLGLGRSGGEHQHPPPWCHPPPPHTHREYTDYRLHHITPTPAAAAAAAYWF